MESTAAMPRPVAAEAGPTAGSPYIGVGVYTIPAAARILGIRSGKLRRWAESYVFEREWPDRGALPSLPLGQSELEQQKILSFLDLIELQMIHLFRTGGVSTRTIRAASARAAQFYHTRHPLAAQRFHTDGSGLLPPAEPISSGEKPPPRLDAEVRRYQLVLETTALPFLSRLDYDQGEARRYWPLGKDKAVVLDPARSFGEPIDVASGVPTAALYQLHRAGESIERIAHWYRVESEAVAAAIEYERSLAA